jgi:uncharacterized protein (DUF3820 family)
LRHTRDDDLELDRRQNGVSELPFGKYKGQTIAQVPDEYILFICSTFDPGYWLTAAEQEYKKRRLSPQTVALSFGKHAGTLICDLDDHYLSWAMLNLQDNPVYVLIKEEADERGLDLEVDRRPSWPGEDGPS